MLSNVCIFLMFCVTSQGSCCWIIRESSEQLLEVIRTGVRFGDSRAYYSLGISRHQDTQVEDDEVATRESTEATFKEFIITRRGKTNLYISIKTRLD
jgi:hypothetical protein